jgi:SAM-dependent methyltransferase
MSQTYAAVDDSGDPDGAAEWQDQMAQWPAVRAYKDHSRRLIGSLEPVLDVGCGTGVDLAAQAWDQAVGLDPSETMCRRARTAGAVVCQGTAEALPFAIGASVPAGPTVSCSTSSSRGQRSPRWCGRRALAAFGYRLNRTRNRW